MISFPSLGNNMALLVNWEGTSHLELIIGPGDVEPRVFRNTAGEAIGAWDDTPVAATVVEAEQLRAILEDHGTSLALPLVTGCESQLVLAFEPDEDKLDLWILELYPPALSASVRLKASEFRQRLFRDNSATF